MSDVVRQRFLESAELIQRTGEKLAKRIEQAAELVIDCYRNDGAVILFGNGGSAADAQHIAGELVGRLLTDRKPLRAIALNTDSSVLTCLANDYSYDEIFARPLEGIARAGDVAIGLTTSGNSANVVAALKTARRKQMKTIVFTGETGGKCAEFSDVLLNVPSAGPTPGIQQAHQVMYHILCELVEQSVLDQQ